eukprot:gene20558-23351_t
MHLLRAVAAKVGADSGNEYNPKLVYFAIEDEFPEVIEHLQFTKDLYGLDIKCYECGINQGLKEHVEGMKRKSGSDIAPAFILGTRKGDPNVGEQETFAPSSNWMPVAFMRVNPILNWEYGHVWHFLRTFNLPYCSLYEQGYTSLGKKSLTLPNPALRRKYIDNSGALVVREGDSYWPAYMLSDWRLERAGRVAKPELVRASSGENENVRGRSRSRSDACDSVVRSAALVIIGDEILRGFTPEVNLQVAAHALSSIGIPLKKVSIVSDSEEEIAAEVLRMSQNYDIVFTSGGIGATHDDVTVRAIATALQQEIRLNGEMVAYLEQVQARPPCSHSSGQPSVSLDENILRLAMLPEHAKLRFAPSTDESNFFKQQTKESVDASAAAAEESDTSEKSTRSEPNAAASSTLNASPRHRDWPVLQCENIFVLPGIPQFFADKMKLIVQHFLPKNKKPVVRKIVLDLEERNLVSLLDALVAEHNEVKFGSYPFVDHPEFKTIITLEGTERRRVELAVAALLHVMPTNVVLRVEKGAAAQQV